MGCAALLLGLSLAAGQGAAPSSVPSAPGAATPGPATVQPLSAGEQQGLRSVFTKTRPGSLRLEQCPVTGSCDEPDGLGSGFVIQSDASGTLALTAYHVVFGARKLEAVTLDKTRYPVTVVGYDDGHDVALLKINVPAGRRLAILPLAAAAPKVGQSALAIGNGNGDFLVSKTGRPDGPRCGGQPGRFSAGHAGTHRAAGAG